MEKDSNVNDKEMLNEADDVQKWESAEWLDDSPKDQDSEGA